MSPELEAFKECREKIVQAIAQNVKVLSWRLYSAGVISYEVRKKVTGQRTGNAEKDSSCECDLANGIERGIEEDHQNLKKFINMLSKDQALYHEIICDLKKVLSSKTTIAGKQRPSSLSLHEQFDSKITLNAMRRASVSMVMAKPSLPSNSQFGYPTSKERWMSVERRQIYQRLRRGSLPLPEEPAATHFPNIGQKDRVTKQSHSFSTSGAVGTRFAPKKLGPSLKYSSQTDAAGNTQRLVVTVSPTLDPLLPSSTPTLSPKLEPLSFGHNITGITHPTQASNVMGPTLPRLGPTPAISSISSVVHSQCCPKDSSPKTPPLTTSTIQHTATIATYPTDMTMLLQHFHRYKSGNDSPNTSETSSGSPISEAGAAAPVECRKDEAALSHVRATSEKSLSLESCGSSSEDDDSNENLWDELQRIHGELKDVQKKQNVKKRFHKLREGLLRSKLQERERIIRQLEEKLETLQRVIECYMQDKRKSKHEAHQQQELKTRIADLQKEIFSLKKGKT